jgi:hypothetical protein
MQLLTLAPEEEKSELERERVPHLSSDTNCQEIPGII